MKDIMLATHNLSASSVVALDTYGAMYEKVSLAMKSLRKEILGAIAWETS
jgi:hypothetical protein